MTISELLDDHTSGTISEKVLRRMQGDKSRSLFLILGLNCYVT
jgi:hypothetical protein